MSAVQAGEHIADVGAFERHLGLAAGEGAQRGRDANGDAHRGIVPADLKTSVATLSMQATVSCSARSSPKRSTRDTTPTPSGTAPGWSTTSPTIATQGIP